MKEVHFKDIKPFVRYARYFDKDTYLHLHTIKAYDARLLYCYEGNGRLCIDGVEHEIEKGTLLVWKPGVEYKYIANSISEMKIIAFNFDFLYDNSSQTIPVPPERTEEFDESKIIQDIYFSDCPFFNKPIIIHNMGIFYQRLTEIEREFRTKSLFYETRISGILTQILGEIASLDLYKTHKEHTLIKTVSEYMQGNVEKELSNSSLGKIFGYHPNYINQLFVRCTGKSLHKYLEDIRISKAMELLQNTNMPVSEICTVCGYGDLPHFSKVFKKKTGYPPSSFRMM